METAALYPETKGELTLIPLMRAEICRISGGTALMSLRVSPPNWALDSCIYVNRAFGSYQRRRDVQSPEVRFRQIHPKRGANRKPAFAKPLREFTPAINHLPGQDFFYQRLINHVRTPFLGDVSALYKSLALLARIFVSFLEVSDQFLIVAQNAARGLLIRNSDSNSSLSPETINNLPRS